jgi:RHS repeat-associated protein
LLSWNGEADNCRTTFQVVLQLCGDATLGSTRLGESSDDSCHVFDRRIGKQVDDNGDGTYDRTYRYVYDGEDIVLEFNAAGSLANRYMHGPAIDQAFANETGTGTISWLLDDNQGTIRDVVQYNAGTDVTTNVNHLKYDSFGQITHQSNGSNQPLYAYTGREWDSDSQLYYYRARWYDQRVGRFLSEDPLSFAAGDVNLSRYVSNSQTNFVDPSGLEAESSIGAVGSDPGILADAVERRHFAFSPRDDGVLDGSDLPLGRFNPWYWTGIYGLMGVGFNWSCGNYGSALVIREKEKERVIDTQTSTRGVQSDEMRRIAEERNRKPVPQEYNDLIQGAEVAVAGTYGGRPGGMPRSPIGSGGVQVGAKFGNSVDELADLATSGAKKFVPKSGTANAYRFKPRFPMGPEDEALINKLRNRMNKKGWKGEPIVVRILPDGTLEILDGHHRVEAVKRNVKVTEVPWREATPEELEDYLKIGPKFRGLRNARL